MSASLRFCCAVPVGRWHPLLPEAMASLAAQEAALYVAVMDASADPRVRTALEASGIDFAYYREGPDGGQAAAIAEGWRETPGDVLFWLNADDQLAIGALARVEAEMMTDDRPDIVFGGSDFVDLNGRRIGAHDQVAEPTDLILRSNTLSQPSCFVRRSAVDRVGGLDVNLHYVMDWDLWVRLYRAGARFKRIDAVLSSVYMGEGTKTSVFALERLGEVYALVRRNTGPWAALKSVASLGLHTVRFHRSQP
jgi:GT2 family glycosyltransferase